ncbi:glycosyltransferase family 2 protein [Telluria mixta]|uniref:Glycosyltransferase family 2 protein n=1 Tax=Telluria mixta TaxID=34071 RepID=A0ABT2BRV7_9BURK|nr:glycosyltransferase family 2 protein [Telluria mixta]MCS0627853.1 glycosyltransferase family 2 protein [Telluria mixta]WEM94028.1 glycosyltransferase family 2 protein [Telluria mixta]
MFRPCVVIPVYNHEHAIGNVLAQVLAHALPVILVDDGCSAACAAVLDELAAAHPERVMLERHAVNQGKGGAVLTGFERAARDGYTHVLQVDADGQHSVADVPRFLAAARAAPRAVVAGCPVYDESVPALRLYARYLTHVWVWINTLSLAIRDSMCGFRVYPVAPVLALARRRRLGLRMNFDIEILVRLYWDGLAIVNLPTRVGYPEDGVSHFKAWTDNVLISRLHMTLFFGMLPRIPSLLVRAWRS